MTQQNLEFQLDWPNQKVASLLNLRATINRDTIWPTAGSADSDLEIFADDILSFLTDNWHTIFLEQTYPIYNPARPSRLRALAEAAWDQDDRIDSESEDIEIEAFERAHALATCFGGISDVPPLWFMRQGKVIIVDNGIQTWDIPVPQARAAIGRLGNQIAERLARDSKFSTLISAWTSRLEVDSLTLLSTAIGVPEPRAKNLVDAGVLRLPLGFDDAANDHDEIRIAARLTGALGLDEMQAILLRAKQIPHRPSQQFQQLQQCVSKQISEIPESTYRKPHDVGVDMAIFVRQALGYDAAQRVNPEDLLAQLGVQLTVTGDLPESFKGLAIWGRSHGPGIIVAGKHPDDTALTGFQRVTVAHELAHLLMDDDDAVGAVDVLCGRVPPATEQRAKSFAGELLLPTKTAIDVWQRIGHPRNFDGLTALLKTLQKTYGVTKSVAAWKLEHGLKLLGVEDLAPVLDEIVPQR